MATPWQPQGNNHPFEGAIVETSVPAVSGVYGLHTPRQQLFVGAAADLRAALLLHWNGLGNLFLGRQPTHFSFEVCDADTRAQRAQQLIAEHRPTIQALQMLTQAALPGAIVKRQSVEHGSDGGTSAPIAQWLHAAGTGEPSAESRAKYFSRSQLATLAALFMLTASTAGYLGVVTGQNIAARRIAAFAPDAARWPVLAHKTTEAAPPAAGGDTVSAPSADTNSDVKRIDTTRSARTRTKPLPIKVARAPSPDGDAGTAMAKRAVARTPAEVPQPDPSEVKPPVTPKATRELPTHSWSVQIASTLEEKAALQLQEKLKTQGYDAFIVGASVNSAPWYRVRVGRFSAKQEAEATRQTLQSKSNIRSAFVIGN